MNEKWSELNKAFQCLIIKETTFEEGKLKLLELRKNLLDMIMLVKNSFPLKGYALMPFPNSKGYDSKTMAYSIYHIIRIEDIVCNILLANDEQIFENGNYQKRLNIDIKTTGNELNKEELIAFSEKINLNELINYCSEVYHKTNEYIRNLKFNDLKIKVSIGKKEYLYKTDYVSKNEKSIWLIEYWCKKNVLGLLKMPFSRHWIMHVEAFLRIKNEIIKIEKKKINNTIGVCGLSCKHCFLGKWCSGCRSEYNCCSYKTLFKEGICPNVKCASDNKLDGCYNCFYLNSCKKGFYIDTNDGAASSKACAMFISKYGKKVFVDVLNRMHEEYDFKKMQEILGQDYIVGVSILEKYLNNIL